MVKVGVVATDVVGGGSRELVLFFDLVFDVFNCRFVPKGGKNGGWDLEVVLDVAKVLTNSGGLMVKEG